MPLKFADVERNMTKKGFQKDNSHHHFYTYYTTANKQTSIRTKMSHSNRTGTDIGDDLLSKMARQCKIPFPEFKKFVRCTLTQQEYEQTLVDSGKLSADDIS